MLAKLQPKERRKTGERNNSAHTKVSEEAGGGSPSTSVQIPLQPVKAPHWSRRRKMPFHREPMLVQAPGNLWPHGQRSLHWRTFLTGFMISWRTNTVALCSPRTAPNEMDLYCQKSMEACLLWVGPHVTGGENHKEEAVEKKTYDEPTTTPLPCPLMPSRERR